jgi:pSer/pThr/pTyr-binding forkhead associated (FHA) protein
MSSAIHETHLLIIEDDKGRFQLLLDEPIYSIGRDPDCDIRLVSQFVSRHHAMLVQVPVENDSGGGYRIVDGDISGKTSVNGLRINGRKLRSHTLQHEDEIIFGPQVRAIYVHSQYPITLDHPDDEPDDFGTLYAQPHPRQSSPTGAVDKP